ncbi:MAG: hypothetical protein HFJ50_03750 [Clostridia bacterium]|jgi:hypothetical protein|nr:hypothetical protein [Clostridia bacterium]
MLFDILENFSKIEEKPLETINIAIMFNHFEDILVNQIIEIAKKVKTLKIVTKNINSFLNLEEILYMEFGIAVQITNNKKRALSNSDVIINYDFGEEKLNEYAFSNECKILNIKEKANVKNKNFCGKVFNEYDISLKENILEQIVEKDDFEKIILYESLIYRKDTYINIKKQFESDGLILRIV